MLSKRDTMINLGLTQTNIIKNFKKHLKPTEDGCIIWVGSKNERGYGWFGISGVAVKAHRFAYALAHGMDALPNGVNAGDGTQLVLNHLCHNRDCVNHEHLEIISHSKNLSQEKRKPRKPNDAIIADNLEDFMEQIRNTERE